MNPAIFAISATIGVSVISLLGIFLYPLKKYSYLMVGIAVGALLGDAFVHILPESYQALESTIVSILLMSGMLLFFGVEKFIRWHHCHDPDCQEHSSTHLVSISLIGDSIHNFIDGCLIAGAFLIDPLIGITTSIAVVLHEIPQEIGDFGIFLHSGLTRFQAIKLNLTSAMFALLGCLITLLFGSISENLINFLLPFTAGGFVYLAASDLIPELHTHHPHPRNSIIQILSVLFGFLAMYLLLFFE